MDNLKEFGWWVVIVVGGIAITSLCESGRLPSLKEAGFTLAIIAIGGILFGGGLLAFFCVLGWADHTKRVHEQKTNDGSLGYRFGQLKYLVALVILGIWALLIILYILGMF